MSGRAVIGRPSTSKNPSADARHHHAHRGAVVTHQRRVERSSEIAGGAIDEDGRLLEQRRVSAAETRPVVTRPSTSRVRNVDQFVRTQIRQRPQQRGVDGAEDRGGRGDAEREGDERDGGEARRRRAGCAPRSEGLAPPIRTSRSHPCLTPFARRQQMYQVNTADECFVATGCHVTAELCKANEACCRSSSRYS